MKKFLFCLVVGLSSFFLIKGSLFPLLPEKNRDIVFYSNQHRDDLRRVLLRAINNSQKSIYIVMFGLTDEKIIKALDKKAKKGLKVEAFYDPRSSALIHNYWATPLKPKGLLHQKIVVLDDATVFVGSANLTPSSLSMHDNLTLGLFSPRLASFIKSHPLTSGRLFTSVSSQSVELWLLPNKKAVEVLKQMIREAKKTITVAMFTFTHKELIEELQKAKQRGVKVKIFLDYKSSRGASLKVAEQLKSSIWVSQGTALLHHKLLWVDKKKLAVGSANWTKAAFEKNCDLLFIIHNLSFEQRKYLKGLKKVMKDECIN